MPGLTPRHKHVSQGATIGPQLCGVTIFLYELYLRKANILTL